MSGCCYCYRSMAVEKSDIFYKYQEIINVKSFKSIKGLRFSWWILLCKTNISTWDDTYQWHSDNDTEMD